ncbi:inorganic diphosphatase [Egicoccus halophilus]|uniref:Inorganic pyrophosphatase n=1 Tax=Egicoccus halophilus TaxID=1670830 RepID=A0A8J3ETA5_9ACTN|nr:inorganic diphosphatase [Egicoccus halophilus]GGI09133.1 inorganic pyrophosphatase [Egicoccus halophilus]
MTNLERLPVGDDAPAVVNVVVEVSVGSRNKYEYDPELGVLVRDRVLPGAVRYPTDYGFVPSTTAADGDALDVVLAAYDAAVPGTVVRARPVGVLHLVDASGEDRNLVAVPDDDDRFADITDIDDLPEANRREIRQFFETYKQLEGDDRVEVRGWLDAEAARRLVHDAMRA